MIIIYISTDLIDLLTLVNLLDLVDLLNLVDLLDLVDKLDLVNLLSSVISYSGFMIFTIFEVVDNIELISWSKLLIKLFKSFVNSSSIDSSDNISLWIKSRYFFIRFLFFDGLISSDCDCCLSTSTFGSLITELNAIGSCENNCLHVSSVTDCTFCPSLSCIFCSNCLFCSTSVKS